MDRRALVSIAILVTATACPAQKAMEEYMDRSKVAEAQMNLRTLTNNLQMYMQMEQFGPDGTVAMGKAPTTAAPPTPPLGTCCAGERHKCAPDPSLWAVEPWQTLKFEITTPHYFSYEYLPASDGRTFTFKAHGDLDCDGESMVLSVEGRWDETLGQPVIDPVNEPDIID